MSTQPTTYEALRATQKSSERYLAIDLGAESGRGMLGEFSDGRIELIEIGRFSTSQGQDDLDSDGVYRWDIDRIKVNIDILMERAKAEHGALSGVGVDSWGVDVGFFDSNGKLLARPVCYRDDANAKARSSVFARMPEEQIWDATGIQAMPFNTLYQLEAIKLREPQILEQAESMLLIPDTLHVLLAGGPSAIQGSEVTDASTSQMMLPGAADWNRSLLDSLGLPHHFLRKVVQAGTKTGIVSGTNVAIYAIASHDTGSAVAAIPADSKSENWAFLSSGTWSLIGVELPKPVLSRDAMHAGFSNEAGVAGTTRFLKNIMGLWLLQQSRQSLMRSGEQYTYGELTAMAADAPSGAIIDATDERLLKPQDMICAMSELCVEGGFERPRGAAAISRCCIESLALAYRRGLRDIERLTGRKIDRLHLVGGGSQNDLLNQWTADSCGIEVLAGPVEAAALGNILGQMVGSGTLGGWNDARELSRLSFKPVSFTPSKGAAQIWAEREERAVAGWKGKRR